MANKGNRRTNREGLNESIGALQDGIEKLDGLMGTQIKVLESFYVNLNESATTAMREREQLPGRIQEITSLPG